MVQDFVHRNSMVEERNIGTVVLLVGFRYPANTSLGDKKATVNSGMTLSTNFGAGILNHHHGENEQLQPVSR